jgi:hypothetical protein
MMNYLTEGPMTPNHAAVVGSVLERRSTDRPTNGVCQLLQHSRGVEKLSIIAVVMRAVVAAAAAAATLRGDTEVSC